MRHGAYSPHSPAPPRAVARETTSVAAMEPRVVKPPGQDLVVERLKSRYGLAGGCLSEVRPGPARFAGSWICGLESGREAGPLAAACGERAPGGHARRRIYARHRGNARRRSPLRLG